MLPGGQHGQECDDAHVDVFDFIGLPTKGVEPFRLPQRRVWSVLFDSE